MYKQSASELHRIFIQGDSSATEIVECFLKRIEHFDSEIKAFLSVFSDRALAKAAELDQRKKIGGKLGRLAGIPIAIKDNIHIKGELTTCASKFLSNYRAPFDATVVKLLEDEDAIILGKTNLDEFAMGSTTELSAYFQTKNPWDLKRTPGGSSGGSAAAAAAKLVPITFGSDTGGSIRLPAAFTGTVGFKPTYGRVSRYGLVAFGSSLDQIGPLAGSVTDVALVMEVIGKHCVHDATSLPIKSELYHEKLLESLSGKIIGIPTEFLKGLDKKMKANFDQSIEIFGKLGVKFIDVNLNMLKYSVATYYILATAEASTNLARFDGIRYGVRSEKAQTLDEVYNYSKEEGFGVEVKQRILLGTYVLSSGYQHAYYNKAQKVRTLIIRDFQAAFNQCDIIAMPVTLEPSFPLGSVSDPLTLYTQDLYTTASNLAGLPAISIPSGMHDKGLPLGLQLLGPQLEDGRVLNFAYQFETQLKCPIPPMFDREASL